MAWPVRPFKSRPNRFSAIRQPGLFLRLGCSRNASNFTIPSRCFWQWRPQKQALQCLGSFLQKRHVFVHSKNVN
jgi:hypothetical protein